MIRRSAVWQQGWRNLHTDGETRIRMRRGVEGQRDGAAVECHWADGAKLDNCVTFFQPTGERRQPVAALGWARPLELYRPFLSYSELGGLLGGKPSEIHDSLQRILGLGRLVEIEKLLKDARHDMDQQRKVAAAALPALTELLAAHPDPRVRVAEAALAAPNPDLASSTPSPPATKPPKTHSPYPCGSSTSSLYRAATRSPSKSTGCVPRCARSTTSPAVRWRRPGPWQACCARRSTTTPATPTSLALCCGGRTVNEAWAAEAWTRLRDLDRRAERLDEAHLAERDARRALRARVP